MQAIDDLHWNALSEADRTESRSVAAAIKPLRLE
jgi:hypothetical protein